MKKVAIGLIFLLGFLLAGCSLKTRWQGFYYPDGCLACSSQYIYSPAFNNLDTCWSGERI